MYFKISVLKNFCKFYRKAPVLESLFNKVEGLKISKICELFKNSFFHRTPPLTLPLTASEHKIVVSGDQNHYEVSNYVVKFVAY